MTRCTFHCRACGLHTHSAEAFNAHRSGSHREGTRHCADPEEVRDQHGALRLAPLTEAGTCDLAVPGQTLDGVMVWTGAKALARARAIWPLGASGKPTAATRAADRPRNRGSSRQAQKAPTRVVA